MPSRSSGRAMSLVTKSMSKRKPSHSERSTHDVSLSMPVFSMSRLRHKNMRRTMLKSTTPTAVAHSMKRMGRGGVMVCKKLRSRMSKFVLFLSILYGKLYAVISRILEEIASEGCGHGQLVATVVLHGRGVTLHPDELHVVATVDAQEAHP